MLCSYILPCDSLAVYRNNIGRPCLSGCLTAAHLEGLLHTTMSAMVLSFKDKFKVMCQRVFRLNASATALVIRLVPYPLNIQYSPFTLRKPRSPWRTRFSQSERTILFLCYFCNLHDVLELYIGNPFHVPCFKFRGNLGPCENSGTSVFQIFHSCNQAKIRLQIGYPL